MAYILFLLATASLIVRPAELIPPLEGMQIYLFLIGSAMVCNIHGLHSQLRTRTFYQQPVNLCVLGIVAAIPISLIVSMFYLGGAYNGFVAMFKTACYYLMLVSIITTPRRLRQFLMVVGISATILVFYSTQDFLAFKAQWQGNDELPVQLEKDRLRDRHEKVLHHVVEFDSVDYLGNVTYRFRMRGFGIFNDPNDVSLLIAVTVVICIYFLLDTSIGPLRFLWGLPFFILGYGYLCTQSRGGLLALGAALMVWLTMRFGKKTAFAIGTLAACAAPLALGRAAKMDISGGSGQERIQIWGEGLAAIKGPKALFGIGQHQFEEVAGHVAHNSYVHAFVEMGIVGGTLFFGCFFLTGYAFYRIKRAGLRINDPELKRMLPYAAAIVTAWCVGMGSLSRCYEISTYLIVGFGAAYINLVGYHRKNPFPIVQLSKLTVQRWAICSAGLFIACFLFVRVFARYGA